MKNLTYRLFLMILLPAQVHMLQAEDLSNSVKIAKIKATAKLPQVTEIPPVVTKFRYVKTHEEHPVFSYLVKEKNLIASEKWLKQKVASIMKLTDSRIIEQLPTKSGIVSVSCPAGCSSTPGSSFSGWNFPDKITCKFCGKTFPSSSYPETHKIKVTAPSGKIIDYSYYQDRQGKKYYFSAHLQFRKAQYFSKAAYYLALLYLLTNDEKYAHKAAVIICGIARNFPDFVYKFDLQFSPVIFFDGLVPLEKLHGYRPSRWSSWAYLDVPDKLILAYDYIYNSKSLSEYAKSVHMDLYKDIEDGFFHRAVEGVLANKESFHNLSPMVWKSLIIAGRVTRAPEYIHIAISRMKTFVKNYFYFDSFWKEPALGYHQQVINLLLELTKLLAGYSDPQGYVSLYSKKTYHNFEPNKEFPEIVEGKALCRKLVYPNGSSLPMADSWYSPKETVNKGQKSYLVPALGYAVLTGKCNGNQVQLHTSFSAKGNHAHDDTLNINLFAEKREMISDIGYTHTSYRAWSKCSPSHNLVVIDYKNQDNSGWAKGKGDIEYMGIDDPDVQIISVDGSRAYKKLSLYRRTSFLIRKDNAQYYIVDFFETQGGHETYDYFLHGSADSEDKLTIWGKNGKQINPVHRPIISCDKLGDWSPPKNEYDKKSIRSQYYQYGFFKDTAIVPADKIVGFIRAQFSAKDASGFSVFVPAGGQDDSFSIYTGKDPSIRPAQKSNFFSAPADMVGKYFRKFVCIRIEHPKRAPIFATVINPYAKKEAVKKVERISPNIMKISVNGDVDFVFTNLRQIENLKISGKILKIQGDYGYISLDTKNNFTVKKYHIVNGTLVFNNKIIVKNDSSHKVPIVGTQGKNGLKLGHAKNPLPLRETLSSFVKVINDKSKISFGYFIKTLGNKILYTQGPLGFKIKEGIDIMEFKAFPHYKLNGENKIIFFNVNFN